MQPRHPVAPSRGGTLGGRARVCGELSVKSCAVRRLCHAPTGSCGSRQFQASDQLRGTRHQIADGVAPADASGARWATSPAGAGIAPRPAGPVSRPARISTTRDTGSRSSMTAAFIATGWPRTTDVRTVSSVTGSDCSDLLRGTFCGRLMPSWPRFGGCLRRTSGEGEIRTLD